MTPRDIALLAPLFILLMGVAMCVYGYYDIKKTDKLLGTIDNDYTE